MSEHQPLTAERVWSLVQEMWRIDDEIRDIARWSYYPRHLREAAEEAEGFSGPARDALTSVVRALKREERSPEAKIRELEDTVERLTHPEFVDVNE